MIDSWYMNSPRKGDACTHFDDAHDWPDSALYPLKQADELALQRQANLPEERKPYYQGG